MKDNNAILIHSIINGVIFQFQVTKFSSFWKSWREINLITFLIDDNQIMHDLDKPSLILLLMSNVIHLKFFYLK